MEERLDHTWRNDTRHFTRQQVAGRKVTKPSRDSPIGSIEYFKQDYVDESGFIPRLVFPFRSWSFTPRSGSSTFSPRKPPPPSPQNCEEDNTRGYRAIKVGDGRKGNMDRTRGRYIGRESIGEFLLRPLLDGTRFDTLCTNRFRLVFQTLASVYTVGD